MTGERLGRHVWEEELIRDACGNFMFTAVSLIVVEFNLA